MAFFGILDATADLWARFGDLSSLCFGFLLALSDHYILKMLAVVPLVLENVYQSLASLC